MLTVAAVRGMAQSAAVLFGLVASAAPVESVARESRLTGSSNPLYVDCARKASEAFGVPLIAILTVLDTERGWSGAESPNRNKKGAIVSYDLGPMQINDRAWGAEFERLGIDRDALRDNGCLNVHAGAWIIWRHWHTIRRESPDLTDVKALAEAILRYHSRTPKHQARYLGMARASLEAGVRRAIKVEQERTTIKSEATAR